MTVTTEKPKPKHRRPTGRRPSFSLEPSPYDLRKPLEMAPERLRHDPRIPTQRRTAFWVVVRGEHIGRVTMVEFEDRPGWFYQPELVPASGGIPKPFGDPMPKRKAAIEAVVDEWRIARRQAKA